MHRGVALSSANNGHALPAQLCPLIFGCEGPELSADETDFFRDVSPTGFILFKRNCVSPAQVAALVQSLRAAVGWHAPILIDQEGGRVQRLRPPHWADVPAFRSFGDIYATDPAQAVANVTRAMHTLAQQQVPMGIDVNCVPVLDCVPLENNDIPAIGDRALGADPGMVTHLGLIAAHAALAAGMTPVMKHMPGHGRARADSHFDLPRVDVPASLLEATDFAPFKAASADPALKDRLWGMSAHIMFTALDAKAPATLSPFIIENIIRGFIGFDGVLTSDDLFMNALQPYGDVPDRVRLCLEAGIDLPLHCQPAPRAAYEQAARAAGTMKAATRARLERWLAKRPENTFKNVA